MSYQPYPSPGGGGYFQNIWDTVVTVIQGLHITIRTWFRDPKQTIHYPDVDIRTGRQRRRPSLGKTGLLRALIYWLDGNRSMGKQRFYKGMLRDVISDRYRGILNVDIEICTACLACERACPIQCIQIIVEKDPDNPKHRYMARFDIDVAKCMYCGLCSEQSICPTGAIYHTKEFESSTPDFPDFIRNYVHEGHDYIFKVKKVKDADAFEA